MSALKILITGANGFVGRALAGHLHEKGIAVREAYRSLPSAKAASDSVAVGDIDGTTDWTDALKGIDVVVHCAARVHIMHDAGSAESLAQFRSVNVEGTRRLALQAAAAGVRRLVFVSSIKVNGETTTDLPPFSHLSEPAPVDAYGISKWEAEQALWAVAQETGLEAVVVRPPLVYGLGVKANFLRLMQTVQRGVPLPFGAVHNRRSMIYVGNLADVLAQCAVHPSAASRTFLVSDGVDLSIGELIRHLATALHRPSRLFNVPPSMMLAVAKILGKSEVADRLLGSLQVDSRHVCETLQWQPPFMIKDGMTATVDSSHLPSPASGRGE